MNGSDIPDRRSQSTQGEFARQPRTAAVAIGSRSDGDPKGTVNFCLASARGLPSALVSTAHLPLTADRVREPGAGSQRIWALHPPRSIGLPSALRAILTVLPRPGPTLSQAKRITLAAALLLATACTPLSTVDVRRIESTRPAPSGGLWNLFLFDPSEPRTLDRRIALARSEVARTPGCTWAGATRAEIAAETLAQGGPRADTLLAAPVSCRRG